MPAYLTGDLEPAEQQEMRAHLASGCPACAGALAEAQATLATLPLALDPVAPSAFAKQRLMQQIDQARGKETSTVASPDRLPDNAALRLFRVFVPAAVAAGIAIMITHAVVMRQMQPELMHARAVDRIVIDQNREIDTLLTNLKEQKRYVDMLRSPNLKVVQLDGAAQPNALARIVWDQKTGEWLMLASGLAPMPANKTYELWLVAAGRKPMPAGIFNADANGQATMHIKLPEDVGTFQLAAVTDEPGWVPAPTGTFQLASKPVQ